VPRVPHRGTLVQQDRVGKSRKLNSPCAGASANAALACAFSSPASDAQHHHAVFARVRTARRSGGL